MPEIGVTLREARMRAGIDIAEVESRTKIRAKYLRALENEEWSLLPGTTFVKSFLRTYAEMLGLDAKLLVEEYKFRHEPYEVAQGGQGAAQRGRRGRRGQQRGGGAFGPQKRTSLLPILLLVVVVGGAIFAVFQLGKSEEEPTATTPTATAPEADPQRASEADREAEARARSAARRVVALRITAPRDESATVCVVDARGKRVANDLDLRAGSSTGRLRSRSFEIVTTEGAIVRDGSKRLRLTADSKNVIAYRITKNKQTRLAESRRPSCS